MIGWDVWLIPPKVRRALTGRDEVLEDEDWSDDRDLVQNDWNGSAKVALLSIERSAQSWAAIAEATGEPEPRRIGDELRTLARELEAAFPDVRKFVRPGFDE